MRQLALHPDRLFSADPDTRSIVRTLHATIADPPIVSPHGHTDPKWFATDAKWTDAASLLPAPDHYLFRMLYSLGIDLSALGIARRDGLPPIDPRADHSEQWLERVEATLLFAGPADLARLPEEGADAARAFATRPGWAVIASRRRDSGALPRSDTGFRNECAAMPAR